MAIKNGWRKRALMVVNKHWRYFFACMLCCSLSAALVAEPQSGSAGLAQTFSVESEREARSILESLGLSLTQKTEIQSILLAAMQSLDAVNAQIGALESDKQRMLSKDIQAMIEALYQQRVQLAEMLSVEILSVLTAEQRSELKLTPKTENVRDSATEQVVREYEI